jgi:hypothetical protein
MFVFAKTFDCSKTNYLSPLPPYVMPFILPINQYPMDMQEYTQYISGNHFSYSGCIDCKKRSTHLYIRCI